MRRYTIFHLPVLSFYSKALYRDVALRWTGIGLGWLILLEAICWAMIMVKLHLAVAPVIDYLDDKLLSQIPKITISKGVAAVDVEQPCLIRYPDSQMTLGLIDTRETPDKQAEDKEILFVLKRREFIVNQPNQAKSDVYSLAKIDSLVLTKETFHFWTMLTKKLFALLAYPFALFGAVVFRAVAMQVYALIGKGICSMVGYGLDYPALLRLAVVAATPVILIETGLDLCGIDLSWWILWPIAFLMTTALLAYGIHAAEPETETPPPMP